MVTAYEIIENSHVGGGMISNSLLLYVIIRFTRKSLGTYKQLQLIFGAYDLFLVMLHAVLKPRVMVVETTIFGVAADWDDRYITTFYCSCNTVPFVLMIIDFLYRYWCISRPHLISLFSNIKFIALLIFFPTLEYIVWSVNQSKASQNSQNCRFFTCTEILTGQGPEVGKDLLRAESVKRLGKEIHEGWLVMNYWENGVLNVRIFTALMIFNTIMIGCFSIAIVLGSLTYYHIYVLGARSGKISAHSLAMQRKLFLSVCAQTAVPLFFVYIPYLCVLNLPFLNLPVFFWDDACMLLTSCFPAWDGLIVIILMPDYWRGLYRMVYKPSSRVESTGGTTSQGAGGPVSFPTVPTLSR